MDPQPLPLTLSLPHPKLPSSPAPSNKCFLAYYPKVITGSLEKALAPQQQQETLLSGDCPKSPGLPSIDWTLALQRAAHQAPLARELLQLLLHFLPQVAQRVKQLLQGAEEPGIIELIHKLHGGALYSGVPRLTALCFTLESQLRQGTPHQVLIPEWQALLDEFTAIEQAAVHWLI